MREKMFDFTCICENNSKRRESKALHNYSTTERERNHGEFREQVNIDVDSFKVKRHTNTLVLTNYSMFIILFSLYTKTKRWKMGSHQHHHHFYFPSVNYHLLSCVCVVNSIWGWLWIPQSTSAASWTGETSSSIIQALQNETTRRLHHTKNSFY